MVSNIIQGMDIDRTVGVNTDYVETTDFKMEAVDKEFCYEVNIYVCKYVEVIVLA